MSRILALQSLPVSGTKPADSFADSALSVEACSTISFAACE